MYTGAPKLSVLSTMSKLIITLGLVTFIEKQDVLPVHSRQCEPDSWLCILCIRTSVNSLMELESLNVKVNTSWLNVGKL